MPAQLVFDAPNGQFAKIAEQQRKVIAEAATEAVRDAAAKVKRQGRAAIAKAGFSKRWENAFRVDVYPKRGASIDAAAFVHHNIDYAGVFEEGATIAGSPLLWLPLPTAPQRIGRRRMTPRLYVQTVGPLIPIRRPGKRPLLAGRVQATRAGRAKVTVAQLRRGARDTRRAAANTAFGGRAGRFATSVVPLFVGLPSVTIRPRFGLQAIFDQARAGLGAAYVRHLKANT